MQPPPYAKDELPIPVPETSLGTRAMRAADLPAEGDLVLPASKTPLAVRAADLLAERRNRTSYPPVNSNARAAHLLWTIPFGLLQAAVLIATVYWRESIVMSLAPAAEAAQQLQASALVPIALLIAFSVFPLCGHMLVAMLTGYVCRKDTDELFGAYAFIMVGTALGEITTYILFRLLLKDRVRRLAKTSLSVAALVEMTRPDHRFVLLSVIPYALVPSSVCTAVFAACGMPALNLLPAMILHVPVNAYGVLHGSRMRSSDGGVAIEDDKVMAVLFLGFPLGVGALATLLMAYREFRRIRVNRL
ncbi:hypothetical protein QBC39DRAFT_370466 [Podospora conica]|nr:hypothetical protein QBC39DRAFT_370466 [Schizothecium conicum]